VEQEKIVKIYREFESEDTKLSFVTMESLLRFSIDSVMIFCCNVAASCRESRIEDDISPLALPYLYSNEM
jgi:hypothetical protein